MHIERSRRANDPVKLAALILASICASLLAGCTAQTACIRAGGDCALCIEQVAFEVKAADLVPVVTSAGAQPGGGWSLHHKGPSCEIRIGAPATGERADAL